MKQKVTYAEFVAAQQKHQEGTVAWVIERMIQDIAAQPNTMKQLGTTHLYGLRAIQRMPIAAAVASSIKRQDIIEFAKWRRQDVGPATANQTLSMLAGAFKYAASTWDDCEDVANGVAAIEAAKTFLTKHGLVSKSVPRKRVPTDEELARLLAYYAEHPGRVIRMPDVIAFALVSTRRIGEICRIIHGDIDWDRKDDSGNPTPMYMVRDLKHPKKKLGNHKWFPLFPELAEIIRRQPRLDPNDPNERVFPFNSRSASASYYEAKKALGIQNLRFHDNRREAITRWLDKFPPHKVKLISGHETTHILERVYDAQDPQDLHKELANWLKTPTPETWNHEPGWKSENG